jgi:hypothetical protein
LHHISYKCDLNMEMRDISDVIESTTISPLAQAQSNEDGSDHSSHSRESDQGQPRNNNEDEDEYDGDTSSDDDGGGEDGGFYGGREIVKVTNDTDLGSDDRHTAIREENGYIEELTLVPREHQKKVLFNRKMKYFAFFVLFGVGSMVGLIVLMIVFASEEEPFKLNYVIGFGSCTSYDLRDQPIWTEGIIPSNIDAWIWAGDIVYLDDPSVNCDVHPESSQCNCETDWLVSSPHGCMAGDTDYARERWQVVCVERERERILWYHRLMFILLLYVFI